MVGLGDGLGRGRMRLGVWGFWLPGHYVVGYGGGGDAGWGVGLHSLIDGIDCQ